MIYDLPRIQDADIKGKTVLLRADLDVPLLAISNKPSAISDDLRLISSLETIKFLLQKASKVIVCGHLGRPNVGDKSLSLEIIANWFSKEFKKQPTKVKLGVFEAWEIGEQFILLENLRFNVGEEENDLGFAKKLASLADIYVNDAFGSSHRKHSSIVGIPSLLPHFAGLHLQKEVVELSKVLENPKRPLTVIIGGAKIETKLPMISKMHHFADFVLVGGELAEHDKELISIQHEKISGQKSVVLIADLLENQKDITPHSVENFIQIIEKSKTVVWNGPLGVVEEEDFGRGTEEIAKGIIANDCHSIVGGGDTVGFLNKKSLLSKFSFVSTGGGALLEFLSGGRIPGITALGHLSSKKRDQTK